MAEISFPVLLNCSGLGAPDIDEVDDVLGLVEGQLGPAETDGDRGVQRRGPRTTTSTPASMRHANALFATIPLALPIGALQLVPAQLVEEEDRVEGWRDDRCLGELRDVPRRRRLHRSRRGAR